MATEHLAEKSRFGVIPNEVRNPSFAIVEQKERFLVVRRGGLLGMTPFLLFSAACETVPLQTVRTFRIEW